MYGSAGNGGGTYSVDQEEASMLSGPAAKGGEAEMSGFAVMGEDAVDWNRDWEMFNRLERCRGDALESMMP